MDWLLDSWILTNAGRHSRLLLAVLMVATSLGVLMSAGVSHADTLVLNGVPAKNPAALLSGNRENDAGTECQQFVEVSTSGTAGHTFTKAGNMHEDTLTCTSEVAIFSETTGAFIRKPVTRWTNDADDHVPFTLKGVRQVPAIVWIVNARNSFSAEKASVQDEILFANDIFSQSRCGFEVVVEDYRDKTQALTNPPATLGCADIGTVLNPKIGRTPGIMNIYVVDALNAPTRAGVACTGESNNVIIVDFGRGQSAIAHEFGHWFALSHTCRTPQDKCGTPMPDVNVDNIMSVEPGSAKNMLTTGQCYRANFDQDSYINKMRIRSGDETRTCANLESADNECPGLKKQID